MKISSLLNRFKSESGQVLVLAALLMTILMGVAAFAVDIGMTTVVKSRVQNIADAAALAGAIDIPKGTHQAELSAINIAKSNDNKLEDSKIHPIADLNKCVVYAKANSANRTVEVIITKKISYAFAQVFGYTDVDISAKAVAESLEKTWSGEALPFVNLGDNFSNKGDKIDVWGSKNNIAPGNKERIHDDAINVPTPNSIVLNIMENAEGPYILMKGGVAEGSKIPTPLTNIVKEGNTVYLFSLKNKLINEDYANNVIKNKINGYELPMKDLVLLKCTVVSNWSKSSKTVYLEYEEAFEWDEINKTFNMGDDGSLGSNVKLIE